MPSVPTAEVKENSLMESIIIGSVISISVSHSSGLMDWFEKKETESWTIILATGEVKSMLNWYNNREHISRSNITPTNTIFLAYKFDFSHSNSLIIEFLFEVTIKDNQWSIRFSRSWMYEALSAYASRSFPLSIIIIFI